MSSGDEEKKLTPEQEGKWETLKKELTGKADIFGKKLIVSNTIALNQYFQTASRLFAVAREADTSKEWKTSYIMYKRYVMLISRELPKHNAYHLPQYRFEKSSALYRAKDAISGIQKASRALRNSIAVATVQRERATPDLSHYRDETSRDARKIETAAHTSEKMPDSSRAMKLTVSELSELNSLKLPSAAYATSPKFAAETSRVKTPYKSPYEHLLRGLRPRESKTTSLSQSSPVKYPVVGKRSAGGKTETDRAFRAALLRVQGMRVVDCKADGNCMFRAVSHQMYGTEDRHVEIRREVCRYMLGQCERFKWLVDPPTVEEFRAYVRKRERPVFQGTGEWGDHAEIIALEEAYDRPIEIYAPSDGPHKPRKTHISGELPKELEFVTPIRLHYQGNNHYNSIVVDGPSSDKERVPLSKRRHGVLRRFRQRTIET